MESKHHTRTKEAKKLLVFIDPSVKEDYRQALLSQGSGFIETKTSKISNQQYFLISQSESSLAIELFRDQISLFSAGLNIINVKKYVSLLTSRFNLINKSQSDFLKQGRKFDSKSMKSFENLSKVLIQNELLSEDKIRKIQLHDQKRKVQKSIRKIQGVQILPKVILDIPSLSSYESCQILIHFKGQSSATSLSCSVSDNPVFESIMTMDFNTIFQIIKKSKSKYFDQSSKEIGHIVPNGICLASTLEFSKFNLIVIVSRNDFLSPTKEDVQSFENSIDYIRPSLAKILKQEHMNEKSGHIMTALDFFPWPIAVLNVSSNTFIYKNRYFRSELETDFFKDDRNSFSRNQVNSNLEIISIDSDDSYISDLYHFQRVSLLGELLNTLKHELSNPLFGLMLAAEIEHGQHDDDIFLDISNNCKRCQNIIKNFSNLYLDESEPTEHNIEDLLKEVLTLTKSETRGIVTKINLVHFPSIESKSICVNPTWITQIIFNLIVNASHSIKSLSLPLNESTIELRAENREKYVLISVIDTGTGLSESIQKEVMKPFFTTKGTGTGLGLSICTNLAENFGSAITYHNNSAGRGATFSFQIPL